MFRPMSRTSAADDYKLILTTDCLVTPDYPVMIPLTCVLLAINR